MYKIFRKKNGIIYAKVYLKGEHGGLYKPHYHQLKLPPSVKEKLVENIGLNNSIIKKEAEKKINEIGVSKEIKEELIYKLKKRTIRNKKFNEKNKEFGNGSDFTIVKSYFEDQFKNEFPNWDVIISGSSEKYNISLYSVENIKKLGNYAINIGYTDSQFKSFFKIQEKLKTKLPLTTILANDKFQNVRIIGFSIASENNKTALLETYKIVLNKILEINPKIKILIINLDRGTEYDTFVQLKLEFQQKILILIQACIKHVNSNFNDNIVKHVVNEEDKGIIKNLFYQAVISNNNTEFDNKIEEIKKISNNLNYLNNLKIYKEEIRINARINSFQTTNNNNEILFSVKKLMHEEASSRIIE